jgi:hypothetical protein
VFLLDDHEIAEHRFKPGLQLAEQVIKAQMRQPRAGI